jgi:hypothetical protein
MEWSRALFEKLIVTQLVKNFLYGTQGFITVFIRAAISHYPEPDECSHILFPKDPF